MFKKHYWKALLLAVPLIFLIMMMSGNRVPMQQESTSEIVAARIDYEIRLDATHPAAEWQRADPVVFSADWQGKNPDPARQTQVRVLWSNETLYLRFECRYREIFVFEDSEPNGRRDHLWDRDAAEAFLQPDSSRPQFYREIEVAPNGMWIDLDIFPGGSTDLKSGLQRSVAVNPQSHTWVAELAIPMTTLTAQFDPSKIWRANFYRIEGSKEPRAYLAWQPTGSPRPNFHVPRSFGTLRFTRASKKG